MDRNTAIEVKNLSKVYRIGTEAHKYDNMTQTFFEVLKNPLQNYRKYRSLYRFSEVELNGDQKFNDVFWAVRDVSFNVRCGETIGIIGRNGAGKSTLLKLLCRITAPTLGQAKIRGKVSSLLEVGTGMHPELTGRENVFLNGTILGMKKNEVKAKFDQIVDFSGIQKFIDTPVKRYSSGMAVRLAFSVAAHLEPDVLVVDEVLAVGDADFQKKCLDKMEDAGQSGRTILFVSHNMASITRLCNRAILLEEGGVVDDGPAHKVVAKYLTTGSGTSAAREWHDPDKAPTGQASRLIAVKIISDEGKISESIDIRREFRIEITFEVFKPGYIFLPHFILKIEDGTTAFVSVDLDENWRHRSRPTGRYVSKATIPGNLLAEGFHFLNVNFLTLNPDRVEFAVSNAVSFTVIDSLEGDSARGDFARHFPGVVRPRLRWETSYSPA